MKSEGAFSVIMMLSCFGLATRFSLYSIVARGQNIVSISLHVYVINGVTYGDRKTRVPMPPRGGGLSLGEVEVEAARLETVHSA